MENKKVYEVFMALSMTELNRLRKFLKSPFITPRTDLCALLNLMIAARKADPSFSTFKIADAYKTIYPARQIKTAKEKQKMTRLVSDLFDKVEEYLIISTVQKNEAVRQNNLLQAYRQLDLEKKFKQTWRSHQKKWEAQPIRSTPYWFHQFEMEFAYYGYIGSRTRDGERMGEAARNFDVYIIAEKLYIGCLQIAHLAVRDKKYNTELLTSIVQHIEKYPDFLAYPVIKIYYHCYKMFTAEDREYHYKQFSQLSEQYNEQSSPTEKRNIHLLFVNYWIDQANTGDSAAIEMAFNLYIMGLEQGILLEDGWITDFSFINIVPLALRLPPRKDRNIAELVEGLINEFKEKLRPEKKENLVLLNRARLAHYQGKYEVAMPLLIQIRSPQPYVRLLSDTLLAKMHYELDEIEPLFSCLTNMESYLRRKKRVLANQHAANFTNFIRLTRKLIRLPLNDSIKKETLRQEIIHTNPLGEREWLLMQLNRRK